MKKQQKMRVFNLVYDEAADAAAKAAADKAAADEAARKASDKGERLFKQEEVNAMIAKERKADREAKQKLTEQLEAIQASKSLTEQEKDALAQQIEDLKTQYMSKEEIAIREKKKLEEKLGKERDDAINASKSWQKRYADSTIQRALMDAAVANEAFAPTQMVAILSQSSKLVEKMDEEGKPTGEYETIVKFEDVDKDGKKKIVELPANEVVKRMKELPELYGNLFKNNVIPGMGGNNGKGGKPVNIKTMKPEEYKAHREKLRAEGKL